MDAKFTTCFDIESELIAEATSATYQSAVDAGARYAFLFGMATVKLSDARNDIVRLKAKIAELEANRG